MHKKDAMVFFADKLKIRRRSDKSMSTAKIASALEITTSAVSQWGEIVPEGSAEKLHRITFNKIPLKAYHYT